MSRAMNLTLPEAEVQASCEASGVRISDIESLPTGGTHLVCVTSEGAEEMRQKLGGFLITKTVRRFPFYRARSPW